MSAATLNVVGGQLLGATGVDVDGSLYSVEFLDGTCVDLFNGCDSVGDFTFSDFGSAFLAGQALLDQVFLDIGTDLFDFDPELTAGCSDLSACFVVTPWSVSAGIIQTRFAYNLDAATADFLGSLTYSSTEDFALDGSAVYAVWSPVPEPGTAILMGLGLLVLVNRSRRNF